MRVLSVTDPALAESWKDLSTMKHLTCRNHPTARYLTKNPWNRGLHFVQAAEGFGAAEECPCPFGDMVVIIEKEKQA